MSTKDANPRPFGLKHKSLLKNSPVSAYDSRFGPEKADSGPLELHYAPINVPGSSFSTGSKPLGVGPALRASQRQSLCVSMCFLHKTVASKGMATELALCYPAGSLHVPSELGRVVI